MIIRAIIIFFISTVFCYGGTIDPNKSDSKHIEYGQQHECVLKIKGFNRDSDNTPYSASCVAINPGYVLTAAHVIENSLVQLIIDDNNQIYIGDKVVIPTEYKYNKKSQYDIAIVKLKTNLSLSFYPALYDKDDEIGKICSIAGYGYPGTFVNGYSISKYDNKKRAGSNEIESIINHVLICCIDKKKTTSLELSISPGDSGGGLFINQKLAGINSYIDAPDGKADGTYGDNTAHTRISVYKNWIEQTITKLEQESK
jgi:secreted trypsin-like serine protease